MKIRFFLVVLALGSAFGAGFFTVNGRRLQPPPLRPFALTGVTVVNVVDGELQAGMTVIVTGRSISNTGPTATTPIPEGVTRIDAAGRYLIPGLWDLHTHDVLHPDFRNLYSPLLVSRGITGVRNMDTYLRPQAAGREPEPQPDIDALEPRVVSSGRMVNGPGSRSQSSILLRKESDARAALDTLARAGSAFIKVYNGVPREAYFALLKAARQRGLDVVGHVPWVVSAAEASDSGQKSVEHLTGMLLGCSAHESELRMRLVAARENTKNPLAVIERRTQVAAAESYEPARCSALAKRMAANGTWHTPTLVNLRNRALEAAERAALVGDERMRHDPTGTARVRLEEMTERPAKERSENQLVRARETEIARLLHQSGVQFLAGSDMPTTLTIPGFSLHDELRLLVDRVGLSPLAALQSATINPARFLGTIDSLGTVESGKQADLVLLNGNPLADIANTRQIEAVVLGGRYLDAEAVKALNERALKTARWRRWATALRFWR